MDTHEILDELEATRERISNAISILGGNGTGTKSRRGRHRLSLAATRRISEMMKKAWAERKKAARAAEKEK